MKKTDPITVGVLGNVPAFFGKEATGYTIDLLAGAVLGRLIYVDNQTAKITGGILESVTSPDQGKTWLLTLHEGQTFHDGNMVTIEDVEFAFGHILSCPYGTPDQSLFASIEGSEEIPKGIFYETGKIKGLKIVNKYVLQIRLKEPDPMWVYYLNDPVLSPIPQSEQRIAGSLLTANSGSSGSHFAWKQHPTGTGPYKIVALENESLLLEKFDDCNILNALLQSAPRHIRLTTSQKNLDRCDVVLGGKSPKQNPDPNILQTIKTGITEAIFGLYFNFDAPLVQNEIFRKALSLAINRSELFSEEENISPTHTMIPRQFRKKNYVFPEPEYNPEKAHILFKELIQQYNVSKLIVPDRNPSASPWKQKLEQHLNELGLPVEFQYGKNIANYDSQTKTIIPFSVWGFIPSLFNAVSIFKIFQAGGGWVSRLPEKDRLYDDLVSKGLQLSLEEQDDYVIKLQHRFLEKVYALPLYETELLFFANPKTIKTLHPEKQNLSFRMELIETV